MSVFKASLATIGTLALLAPAAGAQAVAFQPVVGSFPNGVTLSVTPSVSVDRRYVRMGINPQFTVLNGFDTVLVPAAVGGVGGAGGGGVGGGVGGIVGLAGMNGPINGFEDPTASASQGYPSAGFDPSEPAYGGAAMPQWQQGNRATGQPVGASPKAARRRKGRTGQTDPRPAPSRQAAAAKRP
jgi:hypothetical protein